MGADEKIGLIIMAMGFIGFPLACWILSLWIDYRDDYVGRRCRRADREYYEWEQRQKRKRRRRK